MANTSGTIVSHPAPAFALADTISKWLTTGLVNPTVSTPTFRTGSIQSFTSSSMPATASIPLSSNIVVGDLILFAAICPSNTPTINVPPGFAVMNTQGGGSFGQGGIFWKFAVAGDPGSTVSWSSGLTGTNFAVATCSYSGVNPMVPFYWANASNGAAASLAAPIITTPVASTVVEVWLVNNGSTQTLTGPATQRISVGPAPNAGVCISDQTQGAAGSTGTQTCTNSAGSPAWSAYTVILNGAITGSGTPPTGGWAAMDCWKPTAGADTWTVIQTPSLSNNAGANWYLILSYTYLVGGTSFKLTACETYNATTHTYNAATINASTGSPPYTPGSGTSPPYAQVAGSPNTAGVNYTSLYLTTGSIGAGTNSFMIAANRDGFFLSVLSASTLTIAAYIGTGSTLIANPSLTDPVMLFACDFTPATPTGSVTREPGWTSAMTYWGNYTPQPFVPIIPGTTANMLGFVNGANGDFFLAPGMAVAARWMMARPGGTTGSQGVIRAVLPAWVQYIQESACSWGDTVTESSDTMTFAGLPATAPSLWIDTTVA